MPANEAAETNDVVNVPHGSTADAWAMYASVTLNGQPEHLCVEAHAGPDGWVRRHKIGAFGNDEFETVHGEVLITVDARRFRQLDGVKTS